MNADEHAADRSELESLIAADLRELTAESEQIGRVFADAHDVRPTDFRALLQIMVAETAGRPISSGELGQRIGLSGAGITYLVDRLIESGHVRREPDPADRRKVILRYAERGLDTARSFFTPLARHTRAELADMTDADLAVAHRVFGALIGAQRRFRQDLHTP